MNECPQFGAVFGGCRFEARYDKAALDLTKIGRAQASADQIKAMCAKTYVHDICIRCGRVVERSTPSGNGEGT